MEEGTRKGPYPTPEVEDGRHPQGALPYSQKRRTEGTRKGPYPTPSFPCLYILQQQGACGFIVLIFVWL